LILAGLPAFDPQWASDAENTNREHRHILEGRLSTAQSRLHKDAIRTAYLALAEHDIRTGRDSYKNICQMLATYAGASTESSSATTTAAATTANEPDSNQKSSKNVNVNAALYRALDFCATRLQTAQIGLRIIESAMNAGDFNTVNDFVERLGATMNNLRTISANSSNSGGNDQSNYQESIITEIDVKVKIAKGIERMVSGEYTQAANVLVPLVMRGSGGGNTDNQQQNNNQDKHLLYWPGVSSPEDVAFYAGLMCLITGDRSKMLALADHPEALELVPAVKELLLYWSRANYTPCMRAFSECSNPSASSSTALSQPLLAMGGVVDIYLTESRWNDLVQTIRETCLVQYLRPYQRVKLERLRDLFFPTPQGSEDSLDDVIDTLCDLMDKKLLPPTTRLDCRENILFQTEASVDPGPNIAAMEQRVLDDAYAMLVRLACLEHGYDVSGDTDGDRSRSKASKTGEGSSRRHRGQRRGPATMTDSSDSEDYEDQPEVIGRVGDVAMVGDTGDTHMIDADPSPHQINDAMNPEDMY